MAIWAIADVHASAEDQHTGLPSKPMDVFGVRWQNHVERLEGAWRNSVQQGDWVIVAGDIDWALYLEDALETLSRLDALPGTKVLIRGNHDYWWSSKTTSKVRRALPPSLLALHNDSVQAEGFNICGAKGSPVPGGIDWTDQDAKLLNREAQRLQFSLADRDLSLPTIVALHYPPFYPANPLSPFREIIESERVDCVVYGHLHGDAHELGPQGSIGRTTYRFVAGDAVGFRPVKIAEHGRVLESAPESVEASRMNVLDAMPEQQREHDELLELAEKEMAEKRDEVGNGVQARELYDVPSESAADLAQDQASKAADRSGGAAP